ncbi:MULTISPECIES: FHA domain-containing protein [unclassified Brenneria]|uniref:FHA domain-containing protein n=1 Tax=unclassified Brenneria TaxID=2634434 RepID=UPI00155264D5|nr:FHA domain-containing protein [Brenneria sp. hezel4-2-4]MEE3650488.1 FHA domain-containing protein [Brenneria sp. HEZEL_4_2_4]NPD00444.1 EscD/YscD/HrpQ family type III secretion system inner membrane ring protein [Brenneria sp. hezel4-2-4]
MFELRVLTGLHRGAALPLSGTSWRVGADDDADLVLYDPGIQSHHCLLEKTETGWRLSALAGALCDAEGHAIAQVADLSPGTPFAAGQIWLCVVAADTPWHDEEEERAPPDSAAPEAEASAESAAVAERSSPQPVPDVSPAKPSRLPLWAKGCYLLLSLLLISMIGSWQLQESVAMPAAPSPQDSRRAIGTLPQLSATLHTLLQERELGGAVKTAANHDRITLTGQLTPEEQKKLERMLIQLHQRYRTALIVENRTRLKVEKLPFQIVQVTGGPHANVVTADGRRFFVGDEIDSLRLVSIDDHQIEFGGKQQIKVNW